MHQNIQRMKKKSFFSENPHVLYRKDIISPKQSSVILGFWEKMTFIFPSLKIFDAYELDVNVVNFVYYGKTGLGKYCKIL